MTFAVIVMLLFADPPQAQPWTFDADDAAAIYHRSKRKPDGDKERAIVLRLNAEKQAREPGAAVK